MKNIKKLVSIALISAFALGISGCNMIEKTPEAIAKSSVAKVNDEVITRGELDNSPSMLQLKAQYESQYGTDYTKNTEAMGQFNTQKKSILDQMVTEKLILQKAKELNVGQDDKAINTEVDAKIADVKKNYKTDDEFKTALKSSGFDETSLKVYFKEQLIIQKVVDNITKDVTVKDSDIQAYYTANPNKYTEKPDRINTAHILVKTKEEADKVKARITAGEDFGTIAKELSLDPGTKDKGGELGFVNYVDSGLEENYINAAIKLKVGEVSDPVQTSYGFHIIKCLVKEEYPVKSFDSVKDEIKSTLLEQEKNTATSSKIAEWKKAAKIKTYENNLY